MKVIVVIAALAASGLCWVNIPVTVVGTLSCNSSFYYSIKLLELDPNGAYDVVDGDLETRFYSPSNSTEYKVSGIAFDGWAEGTVEPMLVVDYYCAGRQRCVGQELGDVTEPSVFKIDIDLLTTNLKECRDYLLTPGL